MQRLRKSLILGAGFAALAFLVTGSTPSITGLAQTTGNGKELFENVAADATL